MMNIDTACRLVVSAILLSCCNGTLTDAGAGNAGKVLAGFTLTHTEVRCDKVRSPGARRVETGTRAADNIILNYEQPMIRARSKSILTAMRERGADFVRGFIWFQNIDTVSGPLPKDTLGMMNAVNGQIPADKLRNLAGFIADVKAAGYVQMYLVIGPQGKSNPGCRRFEFGDCFDPTTMPVSWSVVQQIARAARHFDSPQFKVILDIAPELCPVTHTRQPVARNTPMYTRYMLENYARTFHTGDDYVSCAGGTMAQEALDRLHALGRVYSELGLHASALDIHIYDQDFRDVVQVLKSAEAEAERLDTNLLILETYYDHPTLFTAIRELRRGGELRRLRAVAVWPLGQNQACHFSETAPYDLSRLKAALE